MVDQPLINKYRPQSFSEVIGHDEIIRVLERALNSSTHPHSFLLTGPSGVGKTTIARIIANHLSAEVVEIDAASNSGVDSVRELVDLGQHLALSGAGKRLFLIDECHALSKSAWQATLKILEEPPEHLYLALCTTEEGKVPETVKTRCFPVSLKSLKTADMQALLWLICDLEGWKVPEEVLTIVVQAGTGQPRKAITILQAIHDETNREEIGRIISLMDDKTPIIEICRLLVSGRYTWKEIKRQLELFEDSDYDAAPTIMGRYIIAVLLKTDDAAVAGGLSGLLDALVFPSNTFDRKVAFVAMLGKIVFGGNE